MFETLIGMIPTVGFPIVAVIGIGWFVWFMYQQQNKNNQDHLEMMKQEVKEVRDAAKAREDRYFEQNKEFTATMAKFNETLIRIDARLGSLENKIK